MFVSVIFNLVILISNSNQIKLRNKMVIQMIDDNPDALDISYIERVELIPIYFINEMDIPLNLTIKNASTISCVDRIIFTQTGDLNQFLSFEIYEDPTVKYYINKRIEQCGNSSCLIAPKSTNNNCSIKDLFESVKITELSNSIFLFSRGFYETANYGTLNGGFIYSQWKNRKLSKDHYNLILEFFEIDPSVNLTNLSDFRFKMVFDHCEEFLYHLANSCQYSIDVDKDDIFIFIGAISIFFIFAVLASVCFNFLKCNSN